ncbi:MAG: hypothetical protein ABIA74_01935 [bacterium]
MNIKNSQLLLMLFCMATLSNLNSKNINFFKKTVKQRQEIQKAKSIDILLLNALPASGKSEARKYLASLSEKECKEQFGINPTVQLDDFPYVHMMRRISETLNSLGKRGEYFLAPAFSFRNQREWGTLMQLINKDYDDLVNEKIENPKSAALWLFDRMDDARIKSGGKALLSKLDSKTRKIIEKNVEKDAAKLLNEKNAEIERAKNLKEKTIVIEFARGGADCAPMPLPDPYGYKYAYSQLSPQILEKASIFYIWVTPEESRRKNEERADPKDPGSILNHGVARSVMFSDYGCDDMDWLAKNSKKPNTITVNAHGKEYYLPIGKLDNRIDKTTFIRKDKSLWEKEEVTNLRTELEKAFASLTQIA